MLEGAYNSYHIHIKYIQKFDGETSIKVTTLNSKAKGK